MPFYDFVRDTTTSGSANTEVTGAWVKTGTNQETLSIMGAFCNARFATAGGGQFKGKFNTGTTASGGTAQVPQAENLRVAPAAQSTWANDATVITAGTTLVSKISVGFACTGGQGGWVPPVPGAAPQMMPAAANPVDMEFTHNAAQNSVPISFTINFVEGTN